MSHIAVVAVSCNHKVFLLSIGSPVLLLAILCQKSLFEKLQNIECVRFLLQLFWLVDWSWFNSVSLVD